MAVLPDLPGITVSVQVAGQLAIEHDSPNDHGNDIQQIPTKHCYIESTTGAQFSIEISASDQSLTTEKQDGLSYYLYLDGSFVGGLVMSHGDKYPCKMSISHVHTAAASTTEMMQRDLAFAAVTTGALSPRMRIEQAPNIST